MPRPAPTSRRTASSLRACTSRVSATTPTSSPATGFARAGEGGRDRGPQPVAAVALDEGQDGGEGEGEPDREGDASLGEVRDLARRGQHPAERGVAQAAAHEQGRGQHGAEDGGDRPEQLRPDVAPRASGTYSE